MSETCAYHQRVPAVATDARGWWLCGICCDEHGVKRPRQTPEEIMDRWDYSSNTGLLDELAYHGYIIVHPDDVPEADWIDWPDDRRHGWNLCRSAFLRAGEPVKGGAG